MKRKIWLLVAAVVCASGTTVDASTFELLAGQTLDAGNVSLWQGSDEINLEIVTQNGWSIRETHVDVACNPLDFPLTACCNPKIGKFDYVEEDYPDGTFEVLLSVPLSGDESPVLACSQAGDDVYFAVHAIVMAPDGSEETAWGGCYCDNPNAPKIYTLCDKERGNWAEYFWFHLE